MNQHRMAMWASVCVNQCSENKEFKAIARELGGRKKQTPNSEHKLIHSSHMTVLQICIDSVTEVCKDASNSERVGVLYLHIFS